MPSSEPPVAKKRRNRGEQRQQGRAGKARRNAASAEADASEMGESTAERSEFFTECGDSFYTADEAKQITS
jgi:hypothetical protein